MELSKRLKEIAALVDPCYTVADIGTDHGYIPIFLIKEGICVHAIASDINKGPVEKARKNIQNENLGSKIECRLGGGLSVLKPKEADGIVIAGMGGNLIRDILEADMEVVKKTEQLILQPVQNPEVLRAYLYTKGYKIVDEALIFDEGKYYEIIKVQYDFAPVILDPIYYEVSPILLRKEHVLITAYVQQKIHKYQKIEDNILEDTQAANLRREEVSMKIQKLKELI